MNAHILMFPIRPFRPIASIGAAIMIGATGKLAFIAGEDGARSMPSEFDAACKAVTSIRRPSTRGRRVFWQQFDELLCAEFRRWSTRNQ